MNFWELADLETPWCVHVVSTLRVAEHIEAGVSEIGALAAAVGADRGALQRVLRHLARKGMFEETATGQFALNEVSRMLLEPGSRLAFDLDGFGGRMAHAWGTLLSAVRTGRPAYHERFGRPYWEDLDAHPEIAAQFDEMMGPAGHGAPDARVLLDPARWDRVRTVARAAATFEAAGVADRVETVGQSFFDPLPRGADLYLLKNVLNDWPDAETVAILKRCAEAARPGGRVVVMGGACAEGPEPPELLMLVLVGGRVRPLPEFRELAREAGLEVVEAGKLPSGKFAVECLPV